MSDQETIQAPKRKYTRKPKVIATAREPAHASLPETNGREASDSEQSTTSTTSTSLPEATKPKRQYKKKVAISETVDEAPPPPVLERITNRIRDDTDLIDSDPEPEPVTPREPRVSSRTSRTGGEPREKKPRTEKQKAAFEKMREARLKKTEELKRLKEIEREHKQLEKEQNKLNTITEKVVEKAAAIKQRKSRKPAAESFDVLPEPQYIPQIQEKKHREILFV